MSGTFSPEKTRASFTAALVSHLTFPTRLHPFPLSSFS
jgi:hypothetical protein